MNSLFFLFTFISYTFAESNQPSCDSKVFCQGDLLHTIQMAHLYNDSKTFVDMKMKNDEATTLQNFDKFMKSNDNNPSSEKIKQFVSENFEEGNELEEWSPSDYNPEPKFLTKISDANIRTFAKNVVHIWPTLGRKVKPEVFDKKEEYTFVYVENGFIIPGGRFKEFYYWDSYWIVEGLLLCEMSKTVKGMLDNFLSIVKQYGFVPNGARIYYLNRSQPPLLSLMVDSYIKATNDIRFLRDNIEVIEKEVVWWVKNRVVEVTKDGKKYQMVHYAVESGSPRPESYREDYETAASVKDKKAKTELYCNIKSGAESGWDFSGRWIIDKNGGNKGNLTSLSTKRIIPVDLNSFYCQAVYILSTFFRKTRNYDKASAWFKKAKLCRRNIHEVFYSKDDGIWYDYDYIAGKHRKMFYPSNFAPLWAKIYEPKFAAELGEKAAEYFNKQGLEKYKGGIPTSLDHTGQQWDLPNAWPPLQSIIIEGLYMSGSKKAKKLATKLGKQWIEAMHIGYKKTGAMFEKYDSEKPGEYGGGGEYTVQKGFGWTNGVALKFIYTLYTDNK